MKEMQNDCKNCIHLDVCAYVVPDIPTCDSFLSKDILDKIIADGLPVSLDDKETGKQTGFMTDCGWIESLPYSELITGKSEEENTIDKINSIGNVYVVSPEEIKAAEEESLKKHFEKLAEEGKR